MHIYIPSSRCPFSFILLKPKLAKCHYVECALQPNNNKKKNSGIVVVPIKLLIAGTLHADDRQMRVSHW